MTRVLYPPLPSHPQHDVAARQLRAGGGMLAFELEGGRDAGRAFIDALSLPELTASLGSVFTMVVHPPSTTHRQLDDAALAESGITAGLLRVSVGLEDLDDLVATSAGLERPPGRRRSRGARLDHRRPAATAATPGRSLGARPIASPAATLARARAPELNPVARLGRAIWRLLTSVNFAVVQIIVLSLLAVVGMTLRQLPDVRVPLGVRLRHRDGRDPRPLRPGPRVPASSTRSSGSRSFQIFRSTWFTLVAAPAGDLDHRLHARPDAAPVAPVARGPRRPARPVLRPEAARPRGDDRRRGRAVRDVLRRHRFQRPRGDGRRPAGRTCTATATSTRSSRRC